MSYTSVKGIKCMIKLKNIIFSAGPAFVLSFLISIISTGKFGTSLLRAVIFAAVFAVIALAASVLSEKFLKVEGDAESSSEGFTKRTSGSQVDLVVDDESLTDEGDESRFSVSGNMRTLDVGDSAVPFASEVSGRKQNLSEFPQETASEEQGVVHNGVEPGTNSAPADAGDMQPPETIRAAEAVPAKKSDRKAMQEAQMKEIDSLPDMDGIAEEDDNSGFIPDDSFVQDSDFARQGAEDEGERYSLIDGERAKDQDTETMAKAIRTLLKRD